MITNKYNFFLSTVKLNNKLSGDVSISDGARADLSSGQRKRCPLKETARP